MKNIKLFSLLIVLLFNVGLKAQSSIHFNFTDGTSDEYLLADVGKITYTSDNMKLDLKNGNVTTWSLSSVKKYTYSNVSVDSVSAGFVSLNTDSAYTVCYGDSKTLKVDGYLGDIQWQYSLSESAATDTSGWIDVFGATDPVFMFTNIVNNTSYRVVSSLGGNSAVSNVITITLSSYPGIISGNSTLCSGNAGSQLTLNNSLGNITWQKSINFTAQTPTWTIISGANDSTYLTPALTVNTAFRARISCGTSSIYTDGFAISVSKKPIAGTAALSLTTSNSACMGGSKALKLTSSYGSIQWQKGSTSSGPWVDVDGATSTPTTFSNLTENTWFRAQLSSGTCASVFSNAVAVVVKEVPIAGTISAAVSSLCSGSGTTLTLDGSTGVISWQKSTSYSSASPSWSTATGSTSTLNVTGLTASTAYRAVLTNSPCPNAITDYTVITVSPKSVAGTVALSGSTSLSLCNGDSKTLKVTGSVGSMQWQTASSASGTWSNVEGATTTPLLLENLAATALYRVKVTSGVCSTVTSNSITLTVKQPTVAGSISGVSSTLCSGSGTTLTLSGHSGTIAWKKSLNYNADSPTWSSATGTSATFNTGNLTASTSFKAILTNNPCPSSTTSEFVISVDPKVVVKTITANATTPSGTASTKAICASTTKTLTLGSGYSGNIQWQRATASSGPWTNIEGQNAATYTVTNPTLGANYFRVKLTSGVCVSASTTPVAVYYKACTPSIATVEADSITAMSAKVGCTILTNGLSTIIARGICYGTSENPTIAGTKTSEGTGSDNFTSNLNGLNSNTIYYARAYAKNNVGTVYGNQISFTTSDLLPSISTSAADSVTSNSAKIEGVINNIGYASITAKGICWGTSENPTVVENKTDLGAGSESFSSQLKNLTPNTTYYARAYATNSYGTSYGDQVIFTTLNLLIGDNFQGGKVAYILQLGDTGYTTDSIKGLIVAANDQGRVQWGCNGTTITGADGSAIGTGMQNTIDIVTHCSETNFASRLCSDLVLNGFDDWFLPSKLEIQKLYLNKGAIGTFQSSQYWCSTELNNFGAWYCHFNTGYLGYQGKDYSYYVRAVRSFSIPKNSSSSISKIPSGTDKTEVLNEMLHVTARKDVSSKITPLFFEVIAFPNPFESHFNIELSSSSVERVEVKVIDLLGKVLETHESDPAIVNELLIGKSLQNGEYILHVTQGNEQRILRVIKR